MKPYLFTATNAKGKHDSYMRDAESIPQLLTMLEQEGYTAVELIYDEQTATSQTQLAPAYRITPGTSARNYIEARKDPVSHALVSAFNGKANVIAFVIGLVIFVAFSKTWGTVFIAIFAIIAALRIYFVNKRVLLVRSFDRLYQALAESRWHDVDLIAEQLSSNQLVKAEWQFLSEVIGAQAKSLAAQQHIEKALAVFSQTALYGSRLAERYDNGLATIYHLAQQHDKALEHMDMSYEKSAKSAMHSLDVAQLHARIGNLQHAKQMLGKTRTQELNDIGRMMYPATKGIINFREDRFTESLGDFERAHQQTMLYEKNAILWPLIGIVAAYYAVALINTGHLEKAREIISPWTHVINDLKENSLREELTNAGLI